MRRRWGGEKGEYGVVYVGKILDSCDYHYRMCLQYSINGENKLDNIETLKNLKNILTSSIDGIDNLIDTYSDQINVSNDYKTIKNRIEIMIKDLVHDIKQLTICDRIPAEEAGILNYVSPGWGYLSYSDSYNSYSGHNSNTDSDDCLEGEVEKKPMVITSLDPNGASKTPKFFVTNNIILMKTKSIRK